MAVNYSSNELILKAMMIADKFSCRHSDLVITVGRDLVNTLKDRFKGNRIPKYVMINNWIDEKDVYPLPQDHDKVLEFRNKYGLVDKYVIMYSGNIGLYYDLENLLMVIKQFRKGYTLNGVYEPGFKTADGRDVVFAFVGSGSILDKLVLYAKKHHFENVVFIPYQDKENLIYSLNAGDVHWCVNVTAIVPCPEVDGISCPGIAGKNGKLREISTCHFV